MDVLAADCNASGVTPLDASTCAERISGYR